MNTMPDNIIVNSCQYTPVYLIQSPGTTQANSYFLAQSNHNEQKPSDNLKTFYENSGSIENNIRNINTNSPKPRILKKQDSGSIGNNLKLASFLLPKNEHVNKQYVVNNVILKPTETVTANITASTNMLTKFDFDSKIVKLKDVSTARKALPKIKPKEITPAPNPSKLTSVQLIKLGETYHSLNQLSDDQMKMVNHALKIFSDPEKIAPEPTYDPVTNTQFIYKVVSPRDLTVVGKNKIKEKKNEIKKDYIKKSEEKITKHKVHECKQEIEPPPPPVEPKVTRSGRQVKLPKQSQLDTIPDIPNRPKKKNTTVTCFQCSAEFTSLYRLQKHYEAHPTHIPGRVHSNLFHCLLAIIKGGPEENRRNIFIQQLEEFIEKVRSLIPCLLKTGDDAEDKPCTINDDVGRLFGMEPGAYNFDIDALYCVKNKDGYCEHNPAKPEVKPLWKPLQNEDAIEVEIEDCARVNSVEKWPITNKRIWNENKQKSQENAKRMRLASENCDTLIELGMEDLVTFSTPDESNDSAITEQGAAIKAALEINEVSNIDQPELITAEPEDISEKNNHARFRSAHFDIRSSPIKPSSTVFHKFQINPEKLANCEVQIIRSMDIAKKDTSCTDNNALQEIFRDNDLSSKDSFTIDRELKDWILNRSNDDKSEDGFAKCNIIEPELIHIDDDENKLPVNNTPNNLQNEDQNESVLNFLDTLGNACLSYPGTEIRTNNTDFQLDLFSFHNS